MEEEIREGSVGIGVFDTTPLVTGLKDEEPDKLDDPDKEAIEETLFLKVAVVLREFVEFKLGV